MRESSGHPQVIEGNPTPAAAGEAVQEVFSDRLMREVRRALVGRRGKLRMDPQDFADRLGRMIDDILERAKRIREEHEAAARIRRSLAEEPFEYFCAARDRRRRPQVARPANGDAKAVVSALFTEPCDGVAEARAAE